jgi:ferritin-like metal-binding protein YciE
MMAGPQTLKTHLITELKDLLDAEQQLTKVLPDLARRATTPALRIAFERHHTETKNQIHRLRQAFEQLGESPSAKRCEGMHGLIREANAVVSATPEGALRDAVMITSAQKVEHYEIASYGTARTYAQVLGEPRVARLLQDTLEEEKQADAKLTEIAEGRVNDKAAEEWHQVTEGAFEQTAFFAGKAVGVGARTIKRAARAVGLGRPARRGEPALVGQVTSSLNRAVEVASETATDVASRVMSQARGLTKTNPPASRKRATARKSRRPSTQRAKKRTRPSKAR